MPILKAEDDSKNFLVVDWVIQFSCKNLAAFECDWMLNFEVVFRVKLQPNACNGVVTCVSLNNCLEVAFKMPKNWGQGETPLLKLEASV